MALPGTAIAGVVSVTMTRIEAGSRISSLTSTSTDSARSTATVRPSKPLPSTPGPDADDDHDRRAWTPASPDDDSQSLGSRRAAPSRLKTDENGKLVGYV